MMLGDKLIHCESQKQNESVLMTPVSSAQYRLPRLETAITLRCCDRGLNTIESIKAFSIAMKISAHASRSRDWKLSLDSPGADAF